MEEVFSKHGGLALFWLGAIVLALHPRAELASDASVDAQGSGFPELHCLTMQSLKRK